MRAEHILILILVVLFSSCQRTAEREVSQPTTGVGSDSAAITPIPAASPVVSNQPKVKEAIIDGKQVMLIVAKDLVPGLIEDMKYATADNFMKRKLYDDATCYLLEETARKLAAAQVKLSEQRPGLHLKVLDCYRPMAVQQEMWREYTNTPYVANPKTARHPRGRAVDITIVDGSGQDLEMPTPYDDFTPKARPNAPTTPERAANRELLRSVMVGTGFIGVNSEWWHFDNLARPATVERK